MSSLPYWLVDGWEEAIFVAEARGITGRNLNNSIPHLYNRSFSKNKTRVRAPPLVQHGVHAVWASLALLRVDRTSNKIKAELKAKQTDTGKCRISISQQRMLVKPEEKYQERCTYSMPPLLLYATDLVRVETLGG